MCNNSTLEVRSQPNDINMPANTPESTRISKLAGRSVSFAHVCVCVVLRYVYRACECARRRCDEYIVCLLVNVIYFVVCLHTFARVCCFNFHLQRTKCESHLILWLLLLLLFSCVQCTNAQRTLTTVHTFIFGLDHPLSLSVASAQGFSSYQGLPFARLGSKSTEMVQISPE